jgi:hypothetical protein
MNSTENKDGMKQVAEIDESTTEDQLTVEQWLQIRKEGGKKIDAETAEVTWIYGLTVDPYGVIPDLPEELRQVGREEFARAPGSDIWVHFSDLPDETRSRLWEMHSASLLFPAGLPDPLSLEDLQQLKSRSKPERQNMNQILHDEKLAHYATREPKHFLQLDGHYLPRNSGDGLHVDADGDALTSTATVELMQGATVRVLIPHDADPKAAVRQLKKLAKWLKGSKHMLFNVRPEMEMAPVIGDFDAECPF